jgi:hypothetical protein
LRYCLLQALPQQRRHFPIGARRTVELVEQLGAVLHSTFLAFREVVHPLLESLVVRRKRTVADEHERESGYLPPVTRIQIE